MLNVVELFQIGGLVGLVVDLGQLGLEGKTSIKSILGEICNNLEDHHGQRSQGYEMSGRETGRGKNLEKGEESESGRNLVSALMTDQGIVIIGKTGTTEIATGTERGTGKETRVVIVREDVTGTGSGTVVVVGTMIVIETGIATVTALERGKGIGIGKRIMKLGRASMTGGGPVIKIMIMTELNQNMSETVMGWRGSTSMILLSLRRKILNGINTTVIMSIGVLKLNMMSMTDSMSFISTNKTVANMTVWMSRRLLLITTTMIILIVIVINMTKWRRTTTLMIERHLNIVKRRDLELMNGNMCVLRGLFLVSMNTREFDYASHLLYASQGGCLIN